MNRRVITGILLALVGIGIIVVGFIILSSFIRQTLAPPPAPTPVVPITQKVVAASHDCVLGTLLKAEDLTLLDVPVEMAPRGAWSDVDMVIGRITKVPLVAGELVLEHHLANPTNISHDLAFTLGEDTVLMAFSANDLMSGLNVIQRGDVVDIFVSVDQTIQPETQELGAAGKATEPLTRLFTFDAMQRVGVTAIVVEIINKESQSSTIPAQGNPQPTPQPELSNIRVMAYLLALTPQDALVLKHLQDVNGKFDIVLRPPTSTELFKLNPVLSEYIIDQYQLDVNP